MEFLKDRRSWLPILVVVLGSLALFLWARLFWAYFLVFVVTGFLLVLLLPRTLFNAWDKFFLVPLFGAVGSISVGLVASILRVPLTSVTVTVFFLLLLASFLGIVWRKVQKINLSVSKQDAKEYLAKTAKEKWHYLLLFVIVLASVVGKVSSVWLADVPILHDPISHALWAKSIATSGKIEYFYSPGLHILAAFSYLLSGVPIPKHILYITNFYNAFVGVGFFLFILKIFERKVWAVLAAAMFCLGYYPSGFYLINGKNALVLALSVLPVAMLFGYFSLVSFDDLPVGTKVLINSLLFAVIFLIHYPSVVIYVCFLLAVYVYNLFRGQFRQRFLALTKNGLLSTGIGLLLVFVWLLARLSYFFQETAESINAPKSTANLAIPRVGEIMKALVSLSTQIQFFNTSAHNWLLVTFFLGIFVLFFIVEKGRLLIVWFGFFSALIFLIELFQISAVHIVEQTGILSFFLFVVLGSSAVFSYLFEGAKDKMSRWLVFLAVFIFVGLVGVRMLGTYNQFASRQREANMVAKSDLRAMDWIQENIPDDVVILNRATRFSSEGAVFGLDSGLWIPAYTSKKIAMSFLYHSSKEAHENYKLYSEIANNQNNKEALSKLKSRNIGYIYIGAKRIFDSDTLLDARKLSNSHFKQVYKDGGTYVFKILY